MMKATRRKILGWLFGTAAAPAAVVVAKAMPQAPIPPQPNVGRTIRIRFPADFKIIDRNRLCGNE